MMANLKSMMNKICKNYKPILVIELIFFNKTIANGRFTIVFLLLFFCEGTRGIRNYVFGL